MVAQEICPEDGSVHPCQHETAAELAGHVGSQQKGERECPLSPTWNRLAAASPKRISGHVRGMMREDADGCACVQEEQPVHKRRR